MASDSYEFSFRNLAAGLLLAPSSPYAAARSIAKSGIVGPENFYPVVAAVITGLKLFRFALRESTEAVERGARLYQESARTARRPGQLSLLQNVLGAIGIDPNTVNRLLLQAQSIRGPGSAQNVFGNVLRMAQGSGDTGTAQQIRNMRTEIEELAKRMKPASDILGDTSGTFQKIAQEAAVLKVDWEAAFAVILQRGENLITLFIRLGDQMAQFIQEAGTNLTSLIVSSVQNPALRAALLNAMGTSGEPGRDLFPGGTMHPLVTSQFQRLGLSFGNFGGVNYAQQTAQNTKRIADAVAGKGGNSFLTPFAAPAPGFHIP